MKFFLDTANLDEIKKAFELGILDGVTTNPALLSKQSGSYKEGVQSIVALTGGAIVFAEVLATEPEGMIREAKEIAAWGPNMVIKLPMTPAGIQACASLTKEGISCAVTLIYSEPQAVVAAKAGAKYIAPFVARANEVGVDGIETISKIVKMSLQLLLLQANGIPAPYASDQTLPESPQGLQDTYLFPVLLSVLYILSHPACL